MNNQINTNIIRNYQTAEYSKFVELLDSRFPPVSVIRNSYPDTTSAFPGNSAAVLLSSIDIYPKYGILTHITNFDDMSVSLSAENVNIGSVTIKDNDTGAMVDVVTDPDNNLNALRVITQDLESVVDDITIGDKEGHFASVVSHLSALQVTVTNLNDSANLDAFGRLRVSEPKTLLDAKHLYDNLPLLFSQKLSGTADCQFIKDDSMVLMSTINAGDFVIRQSRYHFNYQPGKSLQAFFTGKLNPQPGIVKRMGLYQSLSSSPTTPSDGIYLEVTEDGPYFKIAKTQGTPHTMSFPQSSWNVDKLDGTGPSGATVAMSAAQIFVIDYEWLSLGRVRFGFMQSGKTYYAHYVNHINDLDRPYITSPNQPVRYEIVQTGITPGSMHHICSTVMVEGGEDNLGKPIALSDGEVSSIGTTKKVLLAVRLKNTAHDSSVILKGVEALNPGQNAGMYEVIINPTITSGSLTWTDVANTAVQQSTGGAEVSGGYTLFKSFVGSGLGGSSTAEALPVPGEIVKLGINVDSVPDVVVLTGRTFSNSTSMIGIMNLLERS